MRTLSVRWMSYVFGSAGALSLAALATLQLPAIIPPHQLELAWTLTRVLIEF